MEQMFMIDNQGGNGSFDISNEQNEGNYSVQRMNARHREMIRRIMLGQTNVEIARALEVTPQNVSDVKNSPIVKAKIEHMQNILDAETLDVSTRIQEMSKDAVEVYYELMHGAEREETRRMIAKDVLDKAGFKAADKHVHAHLQGDQIDEMVERAKAQGSVVEEPEDEDIQDAEIVTEENE